MMDAKERRRRVLVEREAWIKAEKQRQNIALRIGRERLREEGEAVQRAMRVGKEGLRTQLGLLASAPASVSVPAPTATVTGVPNVADAEKDIEKKG